MGDAGDLGASVEIDDLNSEQLDERGVVAVDSKEELEGLELVARTGANSVKTGELLDIQLGRVLLVAANLAEGARPLAIESIDLWALTGSKRLVEGTHTLARARRVFTEVAQQILGRGGQFSLEGGKVVEEPLARINVHRHGPLNMPLLFAEPAEDKETAVAHNTGIALHLVALAAMQAGNVLSGLLDGVLVAAVPVRRPQGTGALVFDDQAVIDGVGAAFDEADLITRLDGDADDQGSLGNGRLERDSELRFIGRAPGSRQGLLRQCPGGLMDEALGVGHSSGSGLALLVG